MNEKNEYLHEYDLKGLKLNARKLLSEQDLRLKLVFATFICASVFVMLEYVLSYALINPIYTMFTNIDGWAAFGVDQAYFIVEFLMFSPLLLGFYSLAAGLSNQADVELSHIFGYYRSFVRMCRSWCISLAVVLPIKLFTVIAEVTVQLLDASKEKLDGIPYFALLVLAVVMLIGVFATGLLLCGKFFPFAYGAVVNKDQKLSKTFRDSLRSTKGKLGRIFAFRLSFALLMLLSLATVGVLFIIYTIPYMAVSYSYHSSHLLTGKYKTIDSEDFYNEQ